MTTNSAELNLQRLFEEEMSIVWDLDADTVPIVFARDKYDQKEYFLRNTADCWITWQAAYQAGRTAAQGEQSKRGLPEKIEVGVHAFSKEYAEGWNDCIDEYASSQAGSAEQVSERDRIGAKMPDGSCVTNVYEAYEAGYRAALSAPERKVTDAELPPLPGPDYPAIYAGLWPNPKRAGYTADQMREYALAALNQQGEQTAPEGGSK